MHFQLVVVLMTLLSQAKCTSLESNTETLCNFFKNLSRLPDNEEVWWETNRNIAKSILETKIDYSENYPSCKQYVDSLRDLQDRGNALNAASPWELKMQFLNASSEEYSSGPCVKTEGTHIFVYSSSITKMRKDARELRQSVSDQNEFHSLVTQNHTHETALLNILSGFSNSMLRYLTRFQPYIK
ncbi:uncharacterized protein LOC108149376 [Drosophila elegans]|uniref:uncharacterized protein LOC108149376 n=1 Tax=Drosophila elegans TaxID=30023 RepID=UPI0007E64E08|nr:uncharacterized protein LOC108149376 [Drosophila elegans]